jgi:hypothetical protein
VITSIRLGDRVKLTDRYATVLMRHWKGPRTKIVDWRSRRGVVARLNMADVFIKWDDRNTVDSVPIKAVEKVNA